MSAPPRKVAPKAAAKQPAKAAAKTPGGISAQDWALVQRIAQKHGVDPRLLVAIGVHETGWGTQGAGRPSAQGGASNILGYGAFDTNPNNPQYSGLPSQLEGAASLLSAHGVHNINQLSAYQQAHGANVYGATDAGWTDGVISTYNSVAGGKVPTLANASTGGVNAAKQGQNLATATGTESLFGGAAQTFSKAQLAQLYGFASNFFTSDPSLENLINQAIKGGYSADQFKALLQGTPWYKKYSDSQKQWIQLSTGDPSEAKRQLALKQDQVARTAQSLGVSLTPQDIQKFAHDALSNGLSDQQLQFGLSQHLYQQQSSATGTFGSTIQQLRQSAANYGLNYSDATLRNKAADILGGKDTVDGFNAVLAGAAGTKYTGIADQLKAGKTVADVAQPFIEQMANTLEMDPAAINIQDPTIQKALSYRAAGAGGVVDPAQAPGVQPMWDFERALKDDPRWASTTNAKNTVASAGYALGKAWGVGGV